MPTRTTFRLNKVVAPASVLVAATLIEMPSQTLAECVTRPSGLVSWWRGEGNALDSVGGNHGALLNGASFAPGKVGQAFSFDGVSNTVRIAASSNLNVGLGDGFTIESWINPTETGNGHPIFEWSRDPGGSPYGAHCGWAIPIICRATSLPISPTRVATGT